MFRVEIFPEEKVWTTPRINSSDVRLLILCTWLWDEGVRVDA